MEGKESGAPTKSAKRRQRKKAKEQQKASKQNRAALIVNSSLAAEREKEEIKSERCSAESKKHISNSIDKEIDSAPPNPRGTNSLTGLQEIIENISANSSESDYLYCPVLKQSFLGDNKSLESKLKTLQSEKLDSNNIWKVLQEECESGLSFRREDESLDCCAGLCKASDFFAPNKLNLSLEEDKHTVETYPRCTDSGGTLSPGQIQTSECELETYEGCDAVKKQKLQAKTLETPQVHTDKLEERECETNRNETNVTDSVTVSEVVPKSDKDNSILSAIEDLQDSISKILKEIRSKHVTLPSPCKPEMGKESVEVEEVTLDESGMSKAELRAARKQQKAQQKALKVQKSTQKDAVPSDTKSTQIDVPASDHKSKPKDSLISNNKSSQNDSSSSATKKTSDLKAGSKESSPPSETVKAQSEQGKSKAQLKKERRELQEAQRAAKMAEKQGIAVAKKIGEKGGTPTDARKAVEKESAQIKSEKAAKETIGTPRKTSDGSVKQQIARVPDAIQVDDPLVEKKLAKKLAIQQVPQRTSALRKVKLFRHLEQYDSKMSLTHTMPLVGGIIHPSIIKVGLQMSEGMIRGANARCIAMLSALKNFIMDYRVAEGKELHRDLETRLQPQVSFLKQCRDMSVSMGNAIRFLKLCITQLAADVSQSEAKTSLIASIQEFVREKITLAEEAICQFALEKIHYNDVILTYGWSSAVLEVLKAASSQNIHVVVVDGRAHLDGKCLLQKLVKLGIPCSYCMLGAVPYHMPQVTKVLVGAHALLANGYVLSDCGMSQVALMAHSFNTPLLVCCETYKFCERVQTDAFVFNELGDPDDLVSTSTNKKPLKDWRDVSSLTLLNLHYDVTPPQLVSGVITELGMLPCTSVPVVLRLKYQTPV